MEVSDEPLPPRATRSIHAEFDGRELVVVWNAGTTAALGAVLDEGELFTDEADEHVLHVLPVVWNSQLACDDTSPRDVDLREELGRIGCGLLALLLGGVGGGVVSTARHGEAAWKKT